MNEKVNLNKYLPNAYHKLSRCSSIIDYYNLWIELYSIKVQKIPYTNYYDYSIRIGFREYEICQGKTCYIPDYYGSDSRTYIILPDCHITFSHKGIGHNNVYSFHSLEVVGHSWIPSYNETLKDSTIKQIIKDNPMDKVSLRKKKLKKVWDS